jgi:hypothetical protein
VEESNIGDEYDQSMFYSCIVYENVTAKSAKKNFNI